MSPGATGEAGSHEEAAAIIQANASEAQAGLAVVGMERGKHGLEVFRIQLVGRGLCLALGWALEVLG